MDILVLKVFLYGTNNGRIYNCNTYGTIYCVASGNATGGIIYTNNGLIYNCTNYANKTADAYGGGIVCYNNENGIIKKCYNNAKSFKGTLKLAGIAYKNSGIISKCINNSYVGVSNGVGQAAGISMLNDGIVEYCINNGRIEGWQYGGGLICTNTGRLSNSYNIANIDFNWYPAGICPTNTGIISNCYNLGKMWGSRSCATADSNISNSYSLKINENLAGSNYTNCSFRTEAELKSDEQITLLNTGNTETVWVKDTKGINNGYPILAWQLEN